MRKIILPSAFLAPIQYYAYLYAHPEANVEVCDNYVKQTYRNRCMVAGANGIQALTVPIVKPQNGKSQMRDIRISDHGNWRHLHWNALLSNYERSPFFDYYADDIRPYYERPIEFLVDFNEGLQHAVLTALELKSCFERTTTYVSALDTDTLDLRQTISPKNHFEQDAKFKIIPYYQVFAHKHGFLPNLSILDLLFNMGPESRLILRDSLKEDNFN